jgi:hypothetical protein
MTYDAGMIAVELINRTRCITFVMRENLLYSSISEILGHRTRHHLSMDKISEDQSCTCFAFGHCAGTTVDRSRCRRDQEVHERKLQKRARSQAETESLSTKRAPRRCSSTGTALTNVA